MSVNSQGITHTHTTSSNSSHIQRIFQPHEEDDHHGEDLGKEHDHENHEEHGEHEDHIDRSPVDYLTWLRASLAVLVISITGIFGVIIIPIMQKVFYQHLLQFLIALGKLAGLAFLLSMISFQLWGPSLAML